MTNIFNNEPSDYSPKAIKILETVGTYSEGIKPQKVQAIITRLGFEINKQFLNDFPDLQYILTATTGLNHIDLQECVKRNITVVSLRGETDFLNSVSIPVRDTLVLAENAQIIRITLYSSKVHGVTSKNTGILPERPTFTPRSSYFKFDGLQDGK